jgi:hypothetical protein
MAAAVSSTLRINRYSQLFLMTPPQLMREPQLTHESGIAALVHLEPRPYLVQVMSFTQA